VLITTSQQIAMKAIVVKGGEPQFGANLVYQFDGFDVH